VAAAGVLLQVLRALTVVVVGRKRSDFLRQFELAAVVEIERQRLVLLHLCGLGGFLDIHFAFENGQLRLAFVHS
jgi:hypothetical protein